jgi:hypothetical protein
MRSYIVKLAASTKLDNDAKSKLNTGEVVKRVIGYSVGGVVGSGVASALSGHGSGNSRLLKSFAGGVVGTALADAYMREKQDPITTLKNSAQISGAGFAGGVTGALAGIAAANVVRSKNPSYYSTMSYPLYGAAIGQGIGKGLAIKNIMQKEKSRK